MNPMNWLVVYPEIVLLVIGFGFKTSPVQATYVNGSSMHVLDFEPMWSPANHQLSTSLPGILALAEYRDIDGREAATVGLPIGLWQQLGLAEGDQVRIVQDGGAAQLPARLEAGLPEGIARVPSGLAQTATLGAAFGTLSIAKV